VNVKRRREKRERKEKIFWKKREKKKKKNEGNKFFFLHFFIFFSSFRSFFFLSREDLPDATSARVWSSPPQASPSGLRLEKFEKRRGFSLFSGKLNGSFLTFLSSWCCRHYTHSVSCYSRCLLEKK